MVAMRQALANKRRPDPATTRLRDLVKKLKRGPMPGEAAPMLCTLVAEPFDNPEWMFEPKFDGLRVLGRFDGRQVVLVSRNGKSQNLQLPEIVDALESSLKKPAIVDGEVVALDEHGRSSFRLLQQRFHLQDVRMIEERRRRFPASIYLFDLLYFDRFDLRSLPLEDRKNLLETSVCWSDTVRWTDYHWRTGKTLWQRACREGSEGIIAKQRQSRYVAGRSAAWLKIKCIGRQEFVIGGFTDPQHSRVGLGALLVGYYTDDRKRLIYAGKVGTGYSNEMLSDLRRRLDKLVQRSSPFAVGNPPKGIQVHWVRPTLVAEIAFSEWTQNELLRQPRFEGLRVDKKPRDCVREKPKSRSPADKG
jgi:bifunctional non-homologous end joining protein LigD